MDRSRSEKPGRSENSLEDPAFIEAAMRGLCESEVEFPIKVEGADTLPYAAVIKKIHGRNDLLVIKLIRPLPHELMEGALFKVIFPLEDKRYEAQIIFKGREGYLQYRFTPPSALVVSDRRSGKRFPFRPREGACVAAQDGRVPAMGVAGTLVNIGLGGFAIRVDRVLKLQDGMRVAPSTVLFDRGKSFPRVRIQDLPRLPLLNWWGVVTHSASVAGEVVLGFSFGELGDDEARMLGDCLNFREKSQRRTVQAPSRPEGSSPVAPSRKTREETNPDPTPSEEAAELPNREMVLDPLARMQRRSARILLCMPEGDRRSQVHGYLRAKGFARMECLSSISELKPLIPARGSLPAAAWVLVDLTLAGTGDVEPLAALRTLEHELGELGDLPVAMLWEELDPTLFLDLKANIRILPYSPADAEGRRAWELGLNFLSVS